MYVLTWNHAPTNNTPRWQLRFPRPLSALWEALYHQIQGLELQAAASQRIELPAYKLREASTRSCGSLTFGAGVGRAAFQGRRIVVGRSVEEERVVAFNWCVWCCD